MAAIARAHADPDALGQHDPGPPGLMMLALVVVAIMLASRRRSR